MCKCCQQQYLLNCIAFQCSCLTCHFQWEIAMSLKLKVALRTKLLENRRLWEQSSSIAQACSSCLNLELELTFVLASTALWLLSCFHQKPDFRLFHWWQSVSLSQGPRLNSWTANPTIQTWAQCRICSLWLEDLSRHTSVFAPQNQR